MENTEKIHLLEEALKAQVQVVKYLQRAEEDGVIIGKAEDLAVLIQRYTRTAKRREKALNSTP